MKLNTLPLLTWRQAKVNYAEFELPDFARDCLSMTGRSLEADGIGEEGSVDQEVVEALEGELLRGRKISRVSSGKKRVLIDHDLILARKNSRVFLILDYENDFGEEESFRRTSIRVVAEEGSEVKVCYLSRNDEHHFAVVSLKADVHKDARFRLIQAEVGARKSFFGCEVNLLDEAAEVEIDSIYFVDGNRELDLFYNINHIAKKTGSRICVNGALKDEAKKSFKGTIDFRKGSSESKGSEEEYATLLDDGVRNIAVPVLLCQEDDVEGVHAASAGKIDEDLLFYIMSRGLNLSQAKRIIVESKLIPTLDLIFDEELKKKVWERIEGAM